MNDQPPYQNTPSGTPPPPPGYTYYPDNNAQMPSGAPQGYQQPNIGYPEYPGIAYPQPDSRRGMAITGFILGLISLFLWALFTGVGALLNLLVFILGIIFSSLGIRSTRLRGLAIAGLVLSILGGIITIIIFIIGIAIATHPGSY